MKKTFRFIGITVITAVIVFLSTACPQDNDPAPPPASGSATITVTNQQLHDENYTESSKSGKVNAEYWEALTALGPIVLGTAEIGTVTNGKLSFKLDVAPPEEILRLLEDYFPDGITIPNENARAIDVYLEFNDGSEEYVLSNYYYDENNDYEIWVEYLYLDRDVNVKDSYIDDDWTFDVDCNFKKGFNAVYYVDVGDSSKMTTARPTGANLLKWVYFLPWWN